jgi:hypothetical protein
MEDGSGDGGAGGLGDSFTAGNCRERGVDRAVAGLGDCRRGDMGNGAAVLGVGVGDLVDNAASGD